MAPPPGDTVPNRSHNPASRRAAAPDAALALPFVTAALTLARPRAALLRAMTDPARGAPFLAATATVRRSAALRHRVPCQEPQ